MIREDIEKLTDEEKVNLIQNLSNLEEIQQIIYTLSYDSKTKEHIYEQASERIHEQRRVARRQRRNEKENLQETTEKEKIERFLDTKDLDERNLILDTMSEASKLDLINKVGDLRTKIDIITTLSDEIKIDFIDKIKIEKYKVEVIKSLDYENRINMLDGIKKPSDRREIVETLIEEAYSDEKRIEILNITNKYGIKDLNCAVAKQINSEVLVDNLDKLDKQNIRNFRANGKFKLEDINSNLEKFMVCEGVDRESLAEKNKLYESLAKSNEEIGSTVNFDFLTEKNIHMLSQERFELMACYPDIQREFLKVAHDENKIKIFNKCLDDFIKNNGDSEWTRVTENLLNGLSSYEYEDLLNSIKDDENIDLNKLTKIIANPNVFEIKSVEDLENYEEIKENACRAIMNGDNEEIKKFPKIERMTNIERKKFAVLEKMYGQDVDIAQKFIEKYGEDIPNIEFLDQDSQDYIKNIQKVLNADDEKILDSLYENIEQFGQNDIDSITMETNLKKAYTKEYNKNLFNVEEAEAINENEGIYNAGTDFSMIVTSVAAFHKNSPSDFKEDWNRNTKASQGFCASYIRNDMLGTADIPHLCYGFKEMSEDALMLSGAGDIYSDAKKLNASAAHSEQYLSPDTQINKTEDYNEMVYKRMQNGERKQPDYIVVFKRDGKIANMEEAKKAQQDWGKDEQGKYKMPIVVVDVDKCLELESEKVDNLMKTYKENPTPVNAKEIYQKVRNNRVTTKRWGGEAFREDINLEELKEKMTQIEQKVTEKEEVTQQVTKQDLSENYSKVSAKERTKGIGKFKEFIQNIKAKVVKGTDDKNIEGER